MHKGTGRARMNVGVVLAMITAKEYFQIWIKDDQSFCFFGLTFKSRFFYFFLLLGRFHVLASGFKHVGVEDHYTRDYHGLDCPDNVDVDLFQFRVPADVVVDDHHFCESSDRVQEKEAVVP